MQSFGLFFLPHPSNAANYPFDGIMIKDEPHAAARRLLIGTGWLSLSQVMTRSE